VIGTAELCPSGRRRQETYIIDNSRGDVRRKPVPVAAEKPDPPPKKPRWIDRAFLVIGLGLLVYVVSRVPLADLAKACARLGPAVALTPLIALGWFSLNTTALYLLLDRQVPWWPLLRIRLIGDGYNALLPLGGLGGEPFKLKHLSPYVKSDQLLTALIRDRVLENAIGLLYISWWLALALGSFHFAVSFRVALLAFIPIAALVGVGTALFVVSSLPTRLGGALARWLKLSEQSATPLPRSHFFWAILCFGAARVVGTLEITVLFWLLGLGFHPITILFCYSLLNAAGYLGFAIPQGLGVFEGTTVFLFGILGLPGAAAVALALARRARMLIVGLIGVALHLFS
jgi:hypothetical protein